LDDVRVAIDDGTLQEGHWFDAKGQVEDGDGAKKEIARDLASFANDGGVYLIGVAEDTLTQTFSLTPVPLPGLSEKIEQIAHTRYDPHLFLQSHPIAESSDLTRGVLVVEVPPCPLAPHMVDARYHGRGDKPKYRLSDADVTRLFAVRTARMVTANQLIADQIARDPVEDQRHEDTRWYAVALPLSAPLSTWPKVLSETLG
jgi:hypothetical protein